MWEAVPARVLMCVCFLCVVVNTKKVRLDWKGVGRGVGGANRGREVVDAAAQARGAHTEWGGGDGLSLGMEAAFLRVGLKAECPGRSGHSG